MQGHEDARTPDNPSDAGFGGNASIAAPPRANEAVWLIASDFTEGLIGTLVVLGIRDKARVPGPGGQSSGGPNSICLIVL